MNVDWVGELDFGIGLEASWSLQHSRATWSYSGNGNGVKQNINNESDVILATWRMEEFGATPMVTGAVFIELTKMIRIGKDIGLDIRSKISCSQLPLPQSESYCAE